jgi:hypothetical protein
MTVNQTQTTMNLSGVLDAMPTSENVTASEPINSRTRMDGLMSLREACRANLQASSGRGVVVMTNAGSGPIPSESLESYNPDTQSWKTLGQSSLWKEEKPFGESLEPLPTSGMMCNGILYRLPPLVQAIDGKDSGYWLPTPIARDWKDTPGMAKTAGTRVREDTMPRKIYAREKSQARSGIINPALSLWLMGFPDGWLEID